MRSLCFLSLVLAVMCLPKKVTAERHTYTVEAEKHYLQGNYETATRYLLAVPGLLQLAPKLTSMDDNDRARLFFDLGCTYLARGDSSSADLAFKEAFVLNDRLERGYFENADPGVYWWALQRNQEAARRLKTTRVSSFMRSAIIPGWGQIYRGHKKKGLAFLGAALATSGIVGMKYRSYKQARSHYVNIDPTLFFEKNGRWIVSNDVGPGARQLLEHYRKDQRYINEDGTRYTEWEARYRESDKRARTVNMVLGILSAVYLLNIADSAIFGPAPIGDMGTMGLTVSF